MQTAENRTRYLGSFAVAPLAGAWIEILLFDSERYVNGVAPLAGAWIEINNNELLELVYRVAPLAGAWIEIGSVYLAAWRMGRRSPRGSVD